MKNKKGQFGLSLLVSAIIGIAIFGLVGSIVVGLLGDFAGEYTENSTEYNTTIDSQTGITNLTSRAPIIGSVIFLVIIVGMFTLLQKQRGA